MLAVDDTRMDRPEIRLNGWTAPAGPMTAAWIVMLSAVLTACGSAKDIPAAPAEIETPERCAAQVRLDGPRADVTVPTHSEDAARHFRKRIDAFSEVPLQPGQIIMLGDSLTELNDWTQTLPEGPLLQNRGISGDTSDGILFRIHEITESRPKAVFMLIGTNDLWTGNSSKVTACNISVAAQHIREQSPDTLIFVQTVFPQSWSPASNAKVLSINALLKEASDESGFVLIDTYALMADENGLLNAAYTDDGLHLNEEGYAVWSALISDTVRRHQLAE